MAFGATFDAGVLQVYARDDLWAKLCVEYSPQRQPMIVSVVTRGLSDDCNGPVIDGSEVMGMARTSRAMVFHYSRDGTVWRLVWALQLGASRACGGGFGGAITDGPGLRRPFLGDHVQVGHARGYP